MGKIDFAVDGTIDGGNDGGTDGTVEGKDVLSMLGIVVGNIDGTVEGKEDAVIDGVVDGECTGESGVGGEAEVLRGGEGLLDLVHRPLGAGLGVAADGRGGEAVELRVIGGMDGDKLALQVGGKLGHLDPGRVRNPLELIAIGL